MLELKVVRMRSTPGWTTARVKGVRIVGPVDVQAINKVASCYCNCKQAAARAMVSGTEEQCETDTSDSGRESRD